jgi:hypothetical protein
MFSIVVRVFILAAAVALAAAGAIVLDSSNFDEVRARYNNTACWQNNYNNAQLLEQVTAASTGAMKD